MRRRFKEMQTLIQKAIDDLGAAEQTQLVCDIFEMYFNEHVCKMKKSEEDIKIAEDQFLFQICESINKFGEKQRVARILETVVS
jgi:hypothetical protein